MWCKYFGEKWDFTYLGHKHDFMIWGRKNLPFYQKVVKYDFEVLLENKIYNKKN